jgi:hypothetical protein
MLPGGKEGGDSSRSAVDPDASGIWTPETVRLGNQKGENTMKRGATMLGVFAALCALALPSWAQVRELPTQTITIAGTIETIDQSKRAMNIKTADGKFVAVNVPESVKRFDKFKVGDKIKATYNNHVMVRLKPPGEAPVNTAGTVTSTGKDSGTKMMVRTMTAEITEIDKGASSITFVGPNGWKYSRRVVDPTVFDQVKVGDKVDITWNTDLTVSTQ